MNYKGFYFLIIQAQFNCIIRLILGQFYYFFLPEQDFSPSSETNSCSGSFCQSSPKSVVFLGVWELGLCMD